MFDCSSSYKGKSLNTGWWPQGDVSKPLEVYRMNVHLFGAVSSPSIANFALKQTAVDNSELFSAKTLETIKFNFYVDDCLQSVASVKEAIQLTQDLRGACAQGGFTLNKWVSNSWEVLATIPESHRATLVKQLDLDREKPPLERALGVQWNIQKDTFTFKVAIKNRALTRRTVLSVVSSIYDPLGFLAPFILKAKQILQKLCLKRCGWDEVIPEELSKPWQRWITELSQLDRFEVDRCVKPESFGSVKTVQLHHFCDASEAGYGMVSYLSLTNSNGDIHVAFILAKSRVTPLKQMTIPRLELAAATLAVKVDKMLQKELHMDLENSTFWTDSTTVLKYIHNETKRYYTYVANRIAVIHSLSRVHQWRFVSSGDNPADDASRGLHIEPLLKSPRWLHGPHFLSGGECEWPDAPEDLGHLPHSDPEVKRDITVNCLKLQTNATSSLIQYFSSWKKLLKAVAWLLKLKNLLLLQSRKDKDNVTSKIKGEQQCLTVDDLDEAEKAIICYEQQCHFNAELTLLRKGMRGQSKQLHI